MRKLLSSLVVVGAISTSLFAGANTQTGCGLGTIIIKNPDSAIMYALQATTNGTSGNQTFGITTGTLNCQETRLVHNEKAINFVNANLDALSNEAALGMGEHLDTLAELLEVKDAGLFKANLRANYLAIYNSSDVVGAQVLDRASAL